MNEFEHVPDPQRIEGQPLDGELEVSNKLRKEKEELWETLEIIV